MKNHSSTLKIHWLINISIYSIIYLFKSFTIWELTNPFNWIIDIPTYSYFTRFNLLLYILIWQIVQYRIIYKTQNS